MGMHATDIATIPTQGFSWYVLFLEDRFEDSISREVSTNFLALGQEIGRDALVVRGYEPHTFFKSVYELFTLHQRPDIRNQLVRPSLLISDTAPLLLSVEPETLGTAKLIVFPLAAFRDKPAGTMTDFLRQLAATLRDPDAIRGLTELELSSFKRAWGWMGKYLEIKPSFMGFGFDVTRVLSDLSRR